MTTAQMYRWACKRMAPHCLTAIECHVAALAVVSLVSKTSPETLATLFTETI